MSEPNLGPSPAQITMMSHNIAARIEAAVRGRRKRTRVALAAGVAAVGIALRAAGVVVAIAPPEVRATGFTCFSGDDLGSDYDVIAMTDGELPAEGAERVEAARELCLVSFGMTGVAAPAPTVCELADHRLAVFPNQARLDEDEFCVALGLGPAPR